MFVQFTSGLSASNRRSLSSPLLPPSRLIRASNDDFQPLELSGSITQRRLAADQRAGTFYKPTLEGSFPNAQLAIIGAGHLYHGDYDLQGQLDRILLDNRQHRYVVDPNSENPFRSIQTLPNNVIAVVATPSGLHTPQLAQLAMNNNVKGIICEKPMATTPEQLAQLDFLVQQSQKPLYFATDLYFRALPLLALMGKPMPYKGMLEVVPGLPASAALAQSIQSGRPILNRVTDIQGRWVYNWRSDAPPPITREWLWKKDTGGGVLLDLFVHIPTVLHYLGFRPDPDHPSQNQVLGWDFKTQNYVPLKQAAPPMDADWFAEIATVMRDPKNQPVRFNCQVGLNPALNGQDFLQFTDERGMKLRMPLKYHPESHDSHVELLTPQDQVIGRVRLPYNPYLLMMHHALSFMNTGQPVAMFYEDQKAALEWIFDIQAKARGTA